MEASLNYELHSASGVSPRCDLSALHPSSLVWRVIDLAVKHVVRNLSNSVGRAPVNIYYMRWKKRKEQQQRGYVTKTNLHNI